METLILKSSLLRFLPGPIRNSLYPGFLKPVSLAVLLFCSVISYAGVSGVDLNADPDIGEPCVEEALFMEVCEGEIYDPTLLIPEFCRAQHPSIVYIASASSVQSFQCTGPDGTGCFIYTVYVTVIQPIPTVVNITKLCNGVVNLNEYGCLGENTYWFEEDPVTHQLIGLTSPVVTPATSRNYHVRSVNPCCSLVLQVTVPPSIHVIKLERCEGAPINFNSYLPFDCQQPGIINASVSQTYTFECPAQGGCIMTFQFDVTVLPNIEQNFTYNVNCGEPINLAQFGCGANVYWAMEDPVTYQMVQVPPVGFVATKPARFFGLGPTNPCCRIMVELVFNPPYTIAGRDIVICEGEAINYADYLPPGFIIHPEDLMDPLLPSGTWTGLCYEVIGGTEQCLRYIEFNIIRKPRFNHTISISLNCYNPIDLTQYEHLLPCTGPVQWFSKFSGTEITDKILEPYYDGIEVYGVQLNGCCSLQIKFDLITSNIVPWVFEICRSSEYLLHGQLQDYHIMGFLNGEFDVTAFNMDVPGEHKFVFIDRITKCPFRVQIFNVTNDVCEIDYSCYSEGMILPGYSSWACSGLTPDWKKNGVPAIPNQPIDRLEASGPGVYDLICRDANGNEVSRKQFVLVPCMGEEPGDFSFAQRMSTGIENIGQESQVFTLYPNPIDQVLSIRVNDVPECMITIIDLLGRTIYSSAMRENEKELKIDCTEWGSGVYVVRAYSGDKLLKTEKLVKTH